MSSRTTEKKLSFIREDSSETLKIRNSGEKDSKHHAYSFKQRDQTPDKFGFDKFDKNAIDAKNPESSEKHEDE